MGDASTDQWVVRNEAGAARLPVDVVSVEGPDAAAFLQGQLSQDVAALAVGESARSLLLQPQGKLDAWVRVSRTAERAFLLDVDAGWGEVVLARLQRFKLRTKADLALHRDWALVAVRGPATPSLELDRTGAAVVVPVEAGGVPGVDLLGPDPVVPPGAVTVDPDALETLRIEAGVPRMGVELDESTIPAAAGIVEGSVSWTKGCYTGQELVARIDSRGNNVPRLLRGLVVETNARPPVGADIVVGDEVVGAVTSVAESALLRAPIALGYVRRGIEPPVQGAVRAEGRAVPVRIEALPLVR
ncbi:MAG: hypothetical protein MUF83_05195 [Acidimicrobiales bacterium]|jgi:folate-binding protein YgfZ|nr:hypothetical protein [Acidimicrobiales bacterium]